jgi:hypothetical protein
MLTMNQLKNMENLGFYYLDYILQANGAYKNH